MLGHLRIKFLGVVAVVLAQADDLPRHGHGRPQPHAVRRDGLHAFLFQQGPEAVRAPRAPEPRVVVFDVEDHAADIDNPRAVFPVEPDAGAFRAGRAVPHQFHAPPFFRCT